MDHALRRRVPKGTPIRVTNLEHIRGGPSGVNVETHKTVYTGPERRGKDRRAGNEAFNDRAKEALLTYRRQFDHLTQLTRAHAPAEQIAAAKKDMEASIKGMTQIGFEYGTHNRWPGRRTKNEGLREIYAEDLHRTIPVDLLAVVRKAEKTISSDITRIMRSGKKLSRKDAINQLLKDPERPSIRVGNRYFFVVGQTAVQKGLPLIHVVYDPIKEKVYWMSTRRISPERRNPEYYVWPLEENPERN